jgi:sialic acid synthase SpsE/quercetin dioxygenase-like cupin family protein
MIKDQENLFILDLANNHFGNLNHAKKIIKEFSKIIEKEKINAAIKFQFRNLKTYINPSYIDSENKYIKRFQETKLSDHEYNEIFKLIKKNKIKTACTPFDEESVGKIEYMKFDFIKIASVSSRDFSLLERVVKNKIPKIISTGGLSLKEIDRIYSFMSKKKQNFALMHCVAVYPSKNSMSQLNFIKNLIERYKNVKIGWSTHENPNELLIGPLAYSLGARIFERHIGINDEKYKLNDYSSSPEIFQKWVQNIKKAKKILGTTKFNQEKITFQEEIKTLNSLERGLVSKKNIVKGDRLILGKNVNLVFPLEKKQFSAANFKNLNTFARFNIKKGQPILEKQCELDKKIAKEYQIRSFVHEAKAMLNYANIKIKDKFDMEISHHHGISNFRKTGCFLLNLINKQYAKKILILLPNQKHPLHFHKIKEESFIILFGTLLLKDGKRSFNLKEGDVIHLKKNSWHNFIAGANGCIFEEISTTSLKNDSFYKSNKINTQKLEQRKTFINKWI